MNFSTKFNMVKIKTINEHRKDIILKEDEGVLVTLHEGIVKKKVFGLNSSGLRRKRVSPKEMIDREIRALGMLEGVRGIQRFIKREGDDTFYTKYIPGKSLRYFNRHLDNSYFEMLEEIVRECHERGVYRIGQNRVDFIVSSNEKPAIVDFGNIIFRDDPVAKFPGVLYLAEKYTLLRVADLKKRYTLPEKNVQKSSIISLESEL